MATQAFLTVQGTNGIIIDGCEVKPMKMEGFNSTTVPLTNGSVIEIYRKRFKFEYPSKDIRAALLATPRDPRRRRSLRMSMIQSAQVFTPRVNTKNNPRTFRRGGINDNVDWQALRNPVKMPSNDNSMVILEGNGDDALVVEEEKDLIILEHVDDPHEEVCTLLFPALYCSKLCISLLNPKAQLCLSLLGHPHPRLHLSEVVHLKRHRIDANPVYHYTELSSCARRSALNSIRTERVSVKNKKNKRLNWL